MEQAFKEGDTFELNGIKYEITFVSWREREGKKEMITYSFRTHEEMEKERRDTNPEGA